MTIFIQRLIIAIALFVASLLNAQSITGDWSGTLTTPKGSLEMTFTISEESGTYASTLSIPSQKAENLPTSSTTFKENIVTIAFKEMQMTYSGTLNKDEIKGTFSQAGHNLELNLFRKKEAEKVDLSSIKSRAEQYPAPSVPVKETFFDIAITDDFRNLEDLKNEATLTWMKSQADYTNALINSISGKKYIIDKLNEFNKRRTETVSGLNILENGMYFYRKSTPEDQTAKLYYRTSFESKEELLFDPKAFGKDSEDEHVISGVFPNYDGSIVGIAYSSGGKEVSNIILMDVKSKKIYDDKIEGLRFASCTWLKDNQSFLYLKSGSSDIHDMNAQKGFKTYLHKLSTKVEEDQLVFSKETYPHIEMNDNDIPFMVYDKDEKLYYLFVYNVNPNLNVYYSKSNDLANLSWTPLITPQNEVKNFSIKGDDLYVYTSKDASKFKLLKTSLSKPNFENADEIVAEDTSYKLENFSLTKEGILYTKSRNGIESKLFHTDMNGKKHKEIKLPKKAATIGMSTRGTKFSDVWVFLTGWTMSGERYKYDIEKNKFTREQLSTIVDYPEFKDVIAEEVLVTSHDGVQVPLSIIRKKNTKKDGKTPVLFYGYGAYGISMTPRFNSSLLLWVEQGGILAVAHVRGGGELGDNWHKSGQKTTKPNTWKDLIACTEYMIDEGYTNAEKTVAYSRSAGGILVGGAMTERPDLFKAVIPGVGAMNNVRMEFSPNGKVNIPEFGTMEIEEEAKALLAMDSYHNLKEGTNYPATLVTAGFNDPRVIVWQPAKFAAKLQKVNTSKNPMLLKIDYEAGHGMCNTKDKAYDDIADILSFALWQVGHKDFQPQK